MSEKSNKVMTVFTACFYLFALGSFGIRARWIFLVILILTSFTALIHSDRKALKLKIKNFKSYWILMYFAILILIMLPNARHESDIINYLIFVSITTFVVIIARVDKEEIASIMNMTIVMGVCFAVYMSVFRLFPALYISSVYRLLAPSVKELYAEAAKFGYGLVIGNSYTFADSVIWLGLVSLISKDISEGEVKLKNKLYLIIMLAGIVLEGRKSELLCAVVTIFLLYFYGKKPDIKKLGKSLIYVCLIALSGFFALRYFYDSGLLKRFTVLFERLEKVKSGQIVDYSSGRFGLWRNAINLFLDNPIFGAGWGRFANYTEGYYKEVEGEGIRNTHNVLLQLLCETGVVGTIFVLFPIVMVVIIVLRNTKEYRQKRNDELKLKNHLFTFGILIYSILLSFLDPNFYGIYFWCLFSICFIFEEFAIYYKGTDKALEEEKNES